MGLMITAATVAVVTTLGIVLSLLFESIRFFERIPFFDFIFGLDWRPNNVCIGKPVRVSLICDPQGILREIRHGEDHCQGNLHPPHRLPF